MMNTKKLSTFKRLFMLSVVLVLSLASTLTLTACGSKIPENTVFSVDDLAGKSVGVQLGTTGDIYVSDMESDGSGTKVERYNKGNDAIQALKQGKIDAVVIDAQPAKAFVAANNELMILDEEFVTEEYAICIAKNNSSLTEKVNEALNVLIANGTVNIIILVKMPLKRHMYLQAQVLTELLLLLLTLTLNLMNITAMARCVVLMSIFPMP